ncbi:MAG: glycosyl hydrolase [Bacteroidota bacterium]
MNVKIILFIFLFFRSTEQIQAQLKFIIEDFEGLSDGSSPSDIKKNGLFAFGNIRSSIVARKDNPLTYLGDRCIKLEKEGKIAYGGWGKGIGMNVDLDPNQDYLNFYVRQPTNNINNALKIELQEDDNGNNVYEKELDDSWNYVHKFVTKQSSSASQNGQMEWELVSIPLNKFKDSNQNGDGIFNINYKQGKLFCFVITFIASPEILNGPVEEKNKQTWYFDFISFSKGKLPSRDDILALPSPSSDDLCNIGTWSKEGNDANFVDIASNFEKTFSSYSEKKLGVIHFFQSFAVDGGDTQNHYPSIERINKVVHQGYIPMITLEDHFVNAKPNVKQPNLYSIVEGHFDSFFKEWATEIKQVDGYILLRILHEFNGDWYPWCIVNNDNNPQLLIKAFQHIHTIFKEQKVTNVKFIWCPNSTSFPQEKWNYIMDAYPGDDYVDCIGLDIYNGAGKGLPVWRSFRKEGIENYFIVTQQFPDKPLFICETASRERQASESTPAQNKAEWIKQMSEALKSDMSKVRLLTWFNEKESFKINSSDEAQKAFLNYVIKDDFFKSGTNYIYPIFQH